MTWIATFTCAFGLGAAVLTAVGVPRERDVEFLALSAAAGLGLLGVLLGALSLCGAFSWARWLIPAGALATVVWQAVRFRAAPPTVERLRLRRPSLGTAILCGMIVCAGLGAIAPVAEEDSLTYPLPIATRIVQEGRWRFWPDLARSVYPLSQELLEATLIDAGSERIGLLSAAELALAALLIVLLAQRLAVEAAAPALAGILALGCPSVAFLAASAKEDVLLLVMTAAAVLTLDLSPGSGAVLASGLFAGLAAGSKYTGIPVAIAVVACVPFCCGRRHPFRSVAAASLAALIAGGLWYGVNVARFGNPLVPFMPSLGRFPVTAATAQGWLVGFGSGRGVLDALLAPFRMVYDPVSFGGRGNWINPLAWLGLVGALAGRRRPAMMAVPVVALAVYVTWFEGMQVARLLLPGVALLSIPAADVLMTTWRRVKLARPPIVLAVGLSAGIVIAVGCVRLERYVRDPAGFLERETPYYADIQWMNTHLDPTHDRVASELAPLAYLRVPWSNLGSDFQVEISDDELADPRQLRAALRRQGFTHVFAHPEEIEGLGDALVPIHVNPASRLGGRRFFREPPTETVTVYRISN